MIHLSYRLREGVRIEQVPTGWRIVSEIPLVVLRVNRAAAALLESTRDGCAVGDLAAALVLDEERVVATCERFRRRGILEVSSSAAVIPSAMGAAGGSSAGETTRAAPFVSVVVPTKDRASELDACLDSLAALEYPADRFEVIVVDDGSTDDTPVVAAAHSCRYLVNERNRGQSYSRNRAAAAASGEILAFLDSDCVASPSWLDQLVPFFEWSRVAGVGGLVSGFFDASGLDRYEQVASSLNMGSRLLLMSDDESMGYVPTCNLLVRKDVYLGLGGLREDLRIGEDVDLCWRMRAGGHVLIYSPEGEVWHRHRNALGAMMRRRAAYGASEPLLQSLHPEKRKTVTVRILPALSVLSVAAALISRKPAVASVGLVSVAADAVRTSSRLAAEGVRVRPARVWSSVARAHLSFAYSVSFHLVRYYLVPLGVTGSLVPGLWCVGVAATAYVTAVDYRVKRPRLAYPAFVGYSVAEHVAYQAGVAAGCVRQRSLRTHLLRFRLGRTRRSSSRPSGPYASTA